MHELLTNSLIFNKKITAEYLKMNEGEQYSMSDLEYILKNSCITLKTILRTQKLTTEFCVKYLLDKNEDQCISDMDRYITVNDILRDQPHITLDDITDGLYGGASMDHMHEIPSFEMMPVIQLPPLPPSGGAPKPKVAQDIPSLSKCPFKIYTTIKLDNKVAPELVTTEVQRCLEACKIDCEMLQAGLKLRGWVDGDKGDGSTGEYESMGSVLLVFQLFWSDGNEHLVGVFRRLSGDVIAFNTYYDDVMKLLKAPDSALKSAILA